MGTGPSTAPRGDDTGTAPPGGDYTALSREIRSAGLLAPRPGAAEAIQPGYHQDVPGAEDLQGQVQFRAGGLGAAGVIAVRALGERATAELKQR